MRPVKIVEGRAYPFGRENVDTDLIFPAHHMKIVARDGLGPVAFESVRAQPGNVFDDRRYAGAPILIAGANFGCGSSREHAAWALADMGVQALIAPSFSDIFAGNAFKNGLVTIELPGAAVEHLLDIAPRASIRIDLEALTVTTDLGDVLAFFMQPFRRECLLNGVDEVELTLRDEAAIARHENLVAARQPWLSIIGIRSDRAPPSATGNKAPVS